MKNEIERIIALSDAFGPSGMEKEAVQTADSFLNEYFNTWKDSLQNLYVPVGQQSGPLVLLDAHSDEVGFIVQNIRPDGMLLFLPLGGWNVQSVISCPVTIRTSGGKKITGIVASRPVHYGTSEMTGFEDLIIDPGTTSKEETLALGIRPGDFIVPDAKCRYDEEREIFIGKAFDCRIGCAALIETCRRLNKMPLDVSVMGVLSAQEEVGERGINAVLQQIHPRLAICFEGCPADDTFVEESLIQSGMKKGPMVRHYDRSMITHPDFMAFVQKTAAEYDIPVQYAVRKGGGTNGGILHLHNIPVVVIGIPVRYAHNCVGYTSLHDYEQAINLAVALVENLNEDIVRSWNA